MLADISGSMSRYSRMLLHFAHALGHADAKVESFVFGTRLTRTTRLLKSRDPDIAVAQVVRAVADWSGGTRITTSLHDFNQHWARRVLTGRTTVLLISDGLEHGDTRQLAFEMERLHKRCRRLVWLNPLLRFARFEPRAAGTCDNFGLPRHADDRPVAFDDFEPHCAAFLIGPDPLGHRTFGHEGTASHSAQTGGFVTNNHHRAHLGIRLGHRAKVGQHGPERGGRTVGIKGVPDQLHCRLPTSIRLWLHREDRSTSQRL